MRSVLNPMNYYETYKVKKMSILPRYIKNQFINKVLIPQSGEYHLKWHLEWIHKLSSTFYINWRISLGMITLAYCKCYDANLKP